MHDPTPPDDLFAGLNTREREPSPDPRVEFHRHALDEFLWHIAGKSVLHRTQPITDRGVIDHA